MLSILIKNREKRHISIRSSGERNQIRLDIRLRKQGDLAMINVGDQAPAFSIPNQSGDAISLNSLLGKYVLIWRYPKADTPG